MATINTDRLGETFRAGPERKRAGVGFVNGAAVQGLTEYRAFEWPKGTGRMWRIDPVSYRDATKLVELEVEQMDLAEEWATEADRRAKGEKPDLHLVAELSRRYAAWCERVAAFVGPRMIPTGLTARQRLARRWRKRLRLREPNPVDGAPQNDLAEIVGFFSQCRTNSGTGIRPVNADAN